MATKRRTPTRPKLPAEVKAAYTEIENGVRSLAKSMAEIHQDLRKAERRIEADARARIRALRDEAKTQLKALEARRQDLSRSLKPLAAAAEGSWRDVKQSADAMLAEGRAMAASVIERFGRALGN